MVSEESTNASIAPTSPRVMGEAQSIIAEATRSLSGPDIDNFMISMYKMPVIKKMTPMTSLDHEEIDDYLLSVRAR